MISLRTLPSSDPGIPDLRTPGRLLWWLARRQSGILMLGVLWGVAWMGAQAAVPYALGAGIDAVTEEQPWVAAEWALAVLVLGVAQAVAGVLRHRLAVTNWITAASRVQQLVARHAVALGADLTAQVATGEVVAVSSNDVERIGGAFDVTARFAGAVVSFLAVTAVLLHASPELGLVVVVGIPVAALAVGPLVRPLERRESAQRARFGEATELAADTVAGLRVLRGIGGEDLFLDRFRTVSDEVRRASVRTAHIRSLLDALQVALPGAFVVLVTWLGARLALSGAISPGELVAFYGYTAFLVLPLRTITEAAHKWTRARVAARRVFDVLTLQRTLDDRTTGPEELPAGDLTDAASGFVAPAGRLTALVCADTDEASALVARLGRYSPGEVALGGVPLDAVTTAAVRRTVVVQDKDPVLFAGTVADGLAVPSSGRVTVDEALAAANAEEIVEGLPDGLEAELPERARSLSGGQRQRLALARSLVADPAVLILDEPTSAVDAHTEARIGERVAALRAGRTTVLVTTSPLLLERAHGVALLEAGRVVASGTHRQLLRTQPGYRSTVVREEDS